MPTILDPSGDELLDPSGDPITEGAAPEGTPQTVALGAAVRGPIAYGPRITHGAAPPPLSVGLYHPPALTTLAAPLAESKSRRWTDELNEAGSASVVLQNDDPDLAEVRLGDVLRFELYGYAAFSGIVTEMDRVSIDAAEELGQATTLTAAGVLSFLADAVVYPARGVDTKPIQEDRLFSWPAVDYDDSDWALATTISEGPADYVFGSADEWALADQWPSSPFAPPARWMWASTTLASPTHPGSGTCYFRHDFTVPEGCEQITVYVAADDQATLYLDGDPLVATEFLGATAWAITTQAAEVSPGVHTLAVEVLNGFAPPGVADTLDRYNPAGVLLSVHANTNTGIAEIPLLVSGDGSWRIVEYPPHPPGWTPGEVLRHVIEEAQIRGALTGLTLAFDDETDSDGVAWPEVGDIATKVGTDLLTFARELTGTYIDIWMEPAGWRLWAWVRDGRGEDTSVALHPPTTPSPLSGNLRALTHRRVL